MPSTIQQMHMEAFKWALKAFDHLDKGEHEAASSCYLRAAKLEAQASKRVEQSDLCRSSRFATNAAKWMLYTLILHDVAAYSYSHQTSIGAVSNE